MNIKIGCVIMAAGNSDRYGKDNKLLEPFNETTVIEQVLDNIPFEELETCILVTNNKKIIEIAEKRDIKVLINDRPKLGLGRTVKIGLKELNIGFEGYIFIVCDQPLLTKESIVGLINFWRKEPDKIASLGLGKRIGNPVIFPPSMYDDLLSIDDSEHGRVVMHNHKDLVRIYNVQDPYELMDIDNQDDLIELKKHIK
jgi:molybdenum cofactor cytidylyltransferase